MTVETRNLLIPAVALIAASLAACSPPKDPQAMQLNITREGAHIVKEKGSAVAAKTGSKESREKSTDLNCEVTRRTGTHMRSMYCYGRGEREQNREKLKAKLEQMRRAPPTALESGRSEHGGG